nr:hypothetical protein K-LCC10_0352 [Kaumoebavirus]
MSFELDEITSAISGEFPDIVHYDDEVAITLRETPEGRTQLVGPARVFSREDKPVGVLIYTTYPAERSTPLILFQNPLSEHHFGEVWETRLEGDYKKLYVERFAQGL